MHLFPSAMEMDIDKINNFNDVRGRSHSPSNVSSRSVSLVSRASLILYHERIMINNDLSNQKYVNPINSSQLSYSCDSQGRNHSSLATDLILP